MEKCIWFRRILKLAELDIDDDGVELHDMVNIIKRTSEMGSGFTKTHYNESGERVTEFYSDDRLRLFIKLSIKLGIFNKEDRRIFKSVNAENILNIESRKTTLRELCNSAIESFGITISNITDQIRSMNAPATIQNLSRRLGIRLYYDEFIILQAILQIYGNVNDDLQWTGQVCFGLNERSPELEITEDQKGILEEIAILSNDAPERDRNYSRYKDENKIFVNLGIKNQLNEIYNEKKEHEKSLNKILKDNYDDDECRSQLRNYLNKNHLSNRFIEYLNQKLEKKIITRNELQKRLSRDQ